MSSIYTEKWVLFLDILGFEAYVNDEKKSEEFAKKVLPLFDEILREFPNDISGTFNISQFSDTFIASYESYVELSILASIILRRLLKKNTLSRGAITYGKVFHNGSQFIGPAITRAYNLEKSEAIYPRVIIDRNCEEKIVKMIQGEYKKYGFVMQDFDGYWYVDFLHGYDCGDIISNINTLYETHKNTKHRGKYTWLKNTAESIF